MFIANLSVAEALDSLKTTEQGLTDVEAQRRLREFGYNRRKSLSKNRSCCVFSVNLRISLRSFYGSRPG
jgi:hypothetical protein